LELLAKDGLSQVLPGRDFLIVNEKQEGFRFKSVNSAICCGSVLTVHVLEKCRNPDELIINSNLYCDLIEIEHLRQLAKNQVQEIGRA
jgi:hypothetical protein